MAPITSRQSILLQTTIILLKAKHVPYEKIKEVLESDLGKPLNEIFLYFDEKPVASASIA